MKRRVLLTVMWLGVIVVAVVQSQVAIRSSNTVLVVLGCVTGVVVAAAAIVTATVLDR